MSNDLCMEQFISVTKIWLNLGHILLTEMLYVFVLIQPLAAIRSHAYSEYKHSLTFRVRRYVVIATKPVHRLQIRPILHNYGAPLALPQVTSGSAQ